MDVTLSQALEGYFIHVESRRLSDNTVKAYKNVLGKFAEFIGGETPIEDIMKSDIEAFINRYPELSKKSLRNYHGTLSALWTWLVDIVM